MKPLQRVVWSEGMFMSPHHLQQQDAYYEALLEARLGALTPNNWGVVSLGIDTEALTAGQLQFQEFFGILPDGLSIYFKAGEPEAPPARPVEEHLGPGRRMAEAFIGVPKEREGYESYMNGNSGESISRYRLTTRQVPDHLAPSSIVPVVFAQRNVRILFGTEPRDDFECIKVAEITRSSLGTLQLDESYVPPCLRVSASPHIMEELRRVLGLLTAKQRELSSARRHRDAASVEFTASDVTRFLQLHAVNSALAVMGHFVDNDYAHPREVYNCLLRLAGELSTFAADADPLTLPKFQFTQLSTTFGELFKRLDIYLRSVAIEQCIPVPLETRPGGIHVGKLDDDRFSHCGQFILTVKSDLSEKQVAEQLPKLSKIASVNDIGQIVKTATPGVPLQATYRPPPEVPVKPGVVYFTLATQDVYWKNAMRDRAVALLLPKPFDPTHTKIELLGVPATTH